MVINVVFQSFKQALASVPWTNAQTAAPSQLITQCNAKYVECFSAQKECNKEKNRNSSVVPGETLASRFVRWADILKLDSRIVQDMASSVRWKAWRSSDFRHRRVAWPIWHET